VAQYGSSDSGASLGDILGAALKEKAEATAKETKAAPKADKADKPEKAAKPPKAEKKPAKAK